MDILTDKFSIAIGNFAYDGGSANHAVCIGAYAGTNINSTAAVGVFIGYGGSGNTEGAGNVAIARSPKTNVDGDKEHAVAYRIRNL